MSWYLEVFSKYAEFSGRARRKEYWFFMLFHLIVAFALGLLDDLLGTVNEEAEVGLLSGVYLLASIIPSLAVGVRRLHDTDRSGWWMLIALIPFLGGLVLLVFYVLEGTEGPNRYGEDPKATTVSA